MSLRDRIQASKQTFDSISPPVVPETVLRLKEIFSRKLINSIEVQKVIESNPVVSGEVLKTVNNGLFLKKGETVNSIRDAVNIIGVENPVLLNVVTSAALKTSFKDDLSLKANIELLEYCGDNAYLSAELSRYVADIDPSEAYTFGLFMDVGYLILCSLDEQYIRIQQHALSNPYSALRQEILLGADHVCIGYLISRYWLLPEWLQKSILCHHELFADIPDDKLSARSKDMVAISYIASYVNSEISFGAYISPEFKSKYRFAMEYLGLTDSDVRDVRRGYISGM